MASSHGVKADYSGLNRLKNKLATLEKKEIEWGFLSGTHSQADMTYAALAFLLETGRRNEAGTGWDIPPRPAFRQSVQELRLGNGYENHIRQYLGSYLTSKSEAGLPAFLNASGRYLENSYRESMTDWIVNGSKYKHNARMTINLKGFDRPYVESGELTQNVQYQINQ